MCDAAEPLGSEMEREIAEQFELLPNVVERCTEVLSRTYSGKAFDQVLLVARGSSDNAALYLRYLIEVHLEIPVVLAAPSVWTLYHRQPKFRNCLAIGISQSGSGPDIADVLQKMRDQGHATLAITNTAESRLTEVADQTVLLGVGRERSVAATKTFSASLVAGYCLTQALGGQLQKLVTPDQAWFEKCRAVAQEHADLVAVAESVFVCGRGFEYAIALETSLKLMECANISAKGYSTADFHHGPKTMAGPRSVVVALDKESQKLGDIGADILFAPETFHDEATVALWKIVYGQYLALEASRLKGLDADKPRYLSKVTKTL